MKGKAKTQIDELAGRCLAAFIEAGSLDLSLDQLARKVDVSKRMLIHYFGSREVLEQQVLVLLEDRLRQRFRAERFPAGATLASVVMALWDQSTAPDSGGVLRVLMDATRRSWSGSARAKAFYREQQRLWVELLLKYLRDLPAIEELLQLFQGGLLVYLATGDREQGRRALMRMVRRQSGFPRIK